MAAEKIDSLAKAPDTPAAGTTVPGVEPEFRESRARLSREELLQRRIGDLHLRLDGTPLARLTRRLHEELTQAGLCFRPPVYLSDDWGCPDLVPIIGAPFYLADSELTRLEDELMEGVEAESDDQIMRYLRHEAGHALNYAYRLYDLPAWTAMFGPFSHPYSDDYTPNVFSRSYVRHLPAWYAQKHPDEDFAETFAVWLDPGSNWREVYAAWTCFPKLLYVDELAKRIGSQPPPVTADNYDTQEEYLASTVAEHYSRLAPTRVEMPNVLDSALRDVFPPVATGSNAATPAAAFLQQHRQTIVKTVFRWTGLKYNLVRGLLVHLEERCAVLGLQVRPDSSAELVEVVALVTTLCMNHLQTGEFVRK